MKSCYVIICLFTVIACPFQGLTQDLSSPTKIDFGFVDRFHNRLYDTYIVNTSSESWDLLRWDKESTIDLKVSSRKVLPGDSLHLRLKLNPVAEGSYFSKVDLIFGKHHQEFEIKANIRHVDLSSNTPCPDFDTQADVMSEAWKAGFKVINKETKETLSDVTIQITGTKGLNEKLRTGRDGVAETPLPIDYYNLEVSHQGYAHFQLETYLNRHQNNVLIELTPGRGYVVVRRPGSGVTSDKGSQEALPEKKEEVVVEEIEPPIEEPTKEFDEREFRLNNISFLIDISTSMRQGHKMEILRASLNSLVDMLRADDRVSIITYASSTRVLGSGMSGAEKEALHEMITALQAEGLTAGEAGLKKAYAQSKKHFIDQGNNQVFLITDGALQKGYEKVVKMAADQAEKGIHLSVIAIDANKWAEQKMKDLAETGGGNYLSVDAESEAEMQLKTSIKEQSRIDP